MGLQVDYDQLANAGSMMGSGGMVVMDEDTCMVDVARYFLNFTKEESCGKCTPCREGTARMLEILNRITQGKGTEEDLTLLEVLARVVKETSLCGLGQTAPNPVLSTLNYFRDEYEAHVNYKRCPASVCKEIIFCSCKYSCPLGTDVPAFVALTGHRRYREAYQVIKSVNPLPLTTAYVCHHPCEERCRARDAGESISVKAIKRFACDHMLKEGMKPPRAPKKKRPEQVGIVGSGPAGLACARELATLGYRVTVFEALPVLGGMLAVGVPRFRLPREILEFDIANIARLGVEFKPGVVVGRTFTLKNLFQQGYRSILLALGAHKSLGLGIPRDDAPGVVDPLALLKAVALGKRATVGQRVAVVGGGNAAIDAARTACRLGAREVTIIYRRTRAEMPAIRREVEAALEEGVKIRFLAAPVRVLTKNGRMAGVQCISMMLGELDSGGRPRPVPIPGSEFVLEADTLIPAIGQEPDLASLGERLGLEVSRRNTIVVDPETMAAGRPGIFAAGDVVTGPSTIADSAAGGKAAALSIHRYLQGESLERVYKVAKPSMQVEPLTISEEELEEIERVSIPCTPSVMRRGNFHLVELGLSEEKAVKEAKRCLRCDLERRAA
jgi:NADH-quinone oxidoreductase subunit F